VGVRRLFTRFGWLVVLIAAGCGPVPRDPEGTLDRVRGGTLRVGLVENPPWVVRTAGEPGGAEAELVRRLAAELGAKPEWVWGGEQAHLEALERFRLDLVAGGLTDDTPWKKRVGLTTPYFEEEVRVGVPSSMELPSLDGVAVAVRPGDAAAAYLERKGAVPVPLADLAAATGPVAAPAWRLERLGLTRTGIKLHTHKHVVAVPPGENGWLARVEAFLAGQRDEVKGLLQREAAAP
jgi:polar amino acid transport system substrate-binding protein